MRRHLNFCLSCILKKMRKLILLATLIAMLLSSNSIAQNNTWQADLAEWRAQHAAELQKPDGWLALVGLEWLQPGDNSFGSGADNKIHLPASAPAHVGVLRVAGNTVSILPAASGFPRNLLIGGQAASARTLLVGTDSDKDNPRLRVGSLEMYVIVRGNRFALRIKDAESTALKTFHGLNWFPADGKYRVTARWNPYNPQHTTT